MSLSPFLRGDRIDLRGIDCGDVPFLEANLNDPRIWRHLEAKEPTTAPSAEAFLADVRESDRLHLLVVRDDEPVGHLKLTPAGDWRIVEMGCWIDPDAQGQGYATEASRLVLEYCFAHRRAHKVYARTYGYNEGAKCVLEAVGLTREAVFREEGYVDGEHVDLVRYAILRAEWADARGESTVIVEGGD